MSQYSADFFDLSLELLHHDILESPEIDMDWLSPNTSTLEIRKTDKVPGKGFVYLSGDMVFCGVIDSTSDEEDITKVQIKPLHTIFDAKCVFNTSLQKTSNTLEAAIADIITANWISNTDTGQNLPISVTAITETDQWSLKLEPQTDEGTEAVINALDELIIPALEQYGIVVDGLIDFTTKKVAFTVGKVLDDLKIDADLPSIELTEFQENKLDSEVNKLFIYQFTGSTKNTVIYYLHPDGTYSTTNEDRIYPVIWDASMVSVSNGETLAGVAADEANSYFEKLKYKNYVEFELPASDILVGPKLIKIGAQAEIFHNGKSIKTMLTGKKIGETATLMFGMVRVDYTKRRD